MAYTTFGSEGAIATAMRPHGAGGSPFAVCSSSCCHVAPPSVVVKSPEPETAFGPSPPERKVQPLRRKSHSPANRRSGFVGSIVRPEHPVDRFLPLRMSCQLLPPSVVL